MGARANFGAIWHVNINFLLLLLLLLAAFSCPGASDPASHSCHPQSPFSCQPTRFTVPLYSLLSTTAASSLRTPPPPAASPHLPPSPPLSTLTRLLALLLSLNTSKRNLQEAPNSKVQSPESKVRVSCLRKSAVQFKIHKYASCSNNNKDDLSTALHSLASSAGLRM